VLVPIALVAAGQWRGLAAAIASAAALVLVSAALFGVDAWIWWIRETLESYASADPKWVVYGRIWGDSVYACALLLGVPARLASLIQTGAILVSAAAVWTAFRSQRPADLKLAVLLAATLLAAPHSGAYDVVLLVVAAGLWLAADREPQPLWRWILTLTFWLCAYPPMISAPTRLLPLAVAGLVAVILVRGHRAPRLDAQPQPA
jgi:hypothetical protein